MCDFYKYLKYGVFKIDPEIAHKIAIKSIKYNYFLDKKVHEYFTPYLAQNYLGLQFNSPVGLAAGFDKNGELTGKIHQNGFGFAEVGTCTLFPQSGNDKPRLFRLIEEEGLINRLGFNNDGIYKLIENVEKNVKNHRIPIGINIGPNKNSSDFINDYILMVEKIYKNSHLFSYITINISSPNTPGLRNLQNIENLINLLEKLEEKIYQIIKKKSDQNNQKDEKRLPIFLKISPDLNENDIADIVGLVLKYKLSALIISNTTISRNNIDNPLKDENGGLSGRPLFDISTHLLSEVYKASHGDILLIGVGGISSANDVIIKMRAGASLVQLYTAMVYHGPFLANKINRDLVTLLQRDGIKNISELIGKN